MHYAQWGFRKIMMNGKIVDNEKTYIVQRTKKSKIFFTLMFSFLSILFLCLMCVENRVDAFSELCTSVIIVIGVALLNIHRYRIIVSEDKVMLRPTFGKKRAYVLKEKDILIKRHSDSVYSIYSGSKRMFTINLHLENSARLLCQILDCSSQAKL